MRIKSLFSGLFNQALCSTLFAITLLHTGPVLAAYPDKPIRLIIPSAPGGAPDVLMRTLAQQLSTQMGVPFIVENKPGASYVIGTMEIIRAAPDGYTLGYGNVVSLATNSALLSKIPYQVSDLTLISNAFRIVNIMAVNNDLPVKSIQELIAYAKQNPGKLAFGSDGNGTTSHLGMELFKSMAGIDILHVPYKGATAAVTDLMSGGVQVMMMNTPVAAAHLESGRLRAIGVSDNQRSASFPAIPTIAESGVMGYEVFAWGGLVGPAKMPQDIVDRLNAEVKKALVSPALQERFQIAGAQATPSTPGEFLDLSITETAKWVAVIKASGAKMD
jgi:tripartite-type tricarboxylate transporter receptor subunit TctC